MGHLRQLVAGGFTKNATTPRNPGVFNKSPRLSEGNGGASARTADAVRYDKEPTAVVAEAGVIVPEKPGFHGKAVAVGSGGDGGGVPAPATGCEAPFAEQPKRTPQTAQVKPRTRDDCRLSGGISVGTVQQY